ncbi:MAG: MBL fold metallo-hydrolase [Xanthomonadales bacterium]|nr:MBL fold metallo-hydrolase [Xanthomonadales bacterium]
MKNATLYYPALACLLGLGLAATPALAQESDISFRSTELAAGVFMVEGVGGFGGGNMAILVGASQVAMIDDSMAPLAPKLLAHVTETAGRDIDFMVNTHVHGDHTGGNAHFAESGTIVFAHDNIRKRLVADPAPAGGTGGLPVVTFADGVTFHLDGIEAVVKHLPTAHTDGDAIIHLPEQNIIHSGDVVFHGLFPFIDLDSGGTVDGYIAGQEAIIALADENTKIIPGHGPLTDRAGVQEDLEVLKAGQAAVRALVEQGMGIDEVLAANPLAEFESRNWQFITTERMTRTLYRDLTGES